MVSYQYIEWLFVVLVCQALGFAALFFGIFKKNRHYPKKYLAWFMLGSALYFGIVGLASLGHFNTLRYIFPFGVPFLLCLLPLFYWYIRALTNSEFRATGKQWMHLAPALSVLLLNMAYFLLPEDEAYKFIERDFLSGSFATIQSFLVYVNRASFYVVLTLQFIYYFLKFRKIVREHRMNMENYFSFKENIDLGWLRNLLFGILTLFVVNDLAYVLLFNYNLFSALFFGLGMIAINFYIGFHALMQTTMATVSGNELIQQPLCGNDEIFLNMSTEAQTSDAEIQKYKGSALTSETRETIISKLTCLMNEEELYAEPHLCINQVANRLKVSSKYLSQAINEVNKTNFYNYINELRVTKAKEYMQTHTHGHFSVEGIASQVGFQSKSSFYTAFKKSTGITPAVFRALQTNQGEVSEEVA